MIREASIRDFPQAPQPLRRPILRLSGKEARASRLLRNRAEAVPEAAAIQSEQGGATKQHAKHAMGGLGAEPSSGAPKRRTPSLGVHGAVAPVEGGGTTSPPRRLRNGLRPKRTCHRRQGRV